jgi:hypothetical protein
MTGDTYLHFLKLVLLYWNYLSVPVPVPLSKVWLFKSDISFRVDWGTLYCIFSYLSSSPMGQIRRLQRHKKQRRFSTLSYYEGGGMGTTILLQIY